MTVYEVVFVAPAGAIEGPCIVRAKDEKAAVAIATAKTGVKADEVDLEVLVRPFCRE